MSYSDLLKDVSFFRHLTQEQRDQMASLVEEKTWEVGQIIFLVGDPGDALYVIKRGSVEIFLRDTTGAKVTLAELAAGQMFGEVSLLDNGPRSASAVAQERVELLVVHRNDLEQFLVNNPQAMSGLLSVLGQRLRSADDMLRGHSVRNANQVIEQKLTIVQKTAAWIANFSGSIEFFLINVLFFAFWILWNTDLLPWLTPFDPYPFGFLTMAVSLEAIFLSIIVLLAQSLESSRDKIRGDIEYDVNLRAELEIAHMHTKVDLLHAEVLARLHQIEKKL